MFSEFFTAVFRDNSTPSRTKDKLSAPPVSGLLDTSVTSSSHQVRNVSQHASVLDSTEVKVCDLVL